MGGGGGEHPSNQLMGMCHWMGSHFHDWIDYNGAVFLLELLEWDCTFSDFRAVARGALSRMPMARAL